MGNSMKVLYMKGRGGGKRRVLIDYLISQGIDVKVVDNAEGIRGMSCDYVIVDEWVKDNIDQQVSEGYLEDPYDYYNLGVEHGGVEATLETLKLVRGRL